MCHIASASVPYRLGEFAAELDADDLAAPTATEAGLAPVVGRLVERMTPGMDCCLDERPAQVHRSILRDLTSAVRPPGLLDALETGDVANL
jgi:hypothetical protein